MRILQVIPSAAASYGGPVQVMSNICRTLRDRGHEVLLFSSDADGHIGRWLGSHVYWTGVRGAGGLSQLVVRSDVVHVHMLWFPAGTCACWLAHRRNRPLVISLHGALRGWALQHRRRRKYLYGRLFEKRNLSRASVVHCLNRQEVLDVAKFGVKCSTVVIPNTIGDALWEFSRNREGLERLYPQLRGKVVVLFLGRLHPTKGLDILIPAFARARAAVPNLHLVIAGPDEDGYTVRVRSLIGQAQVESGVSIVGLVEGEAKRSLLLGADLFVLSSYSEGDSVAVKEALAAGLPAVVTHGCGVDPQLGRSGAMVVETDIAGVERGILRLAGDPVLREEMGAAGRSWARRTFSTLDAGARFVKLYADLCEEQRASEP